MSNVILCATRFTNKTYDENKNYKLQKNFTGCLYGTPVKLSNNISDAVSQSRLKFPDLMIEVEADTPEQAIEAAKANADRVMLDNFSPELAKTTIERLKQISDIEIEISGGITLENIIEYSPYSDLISLSGLTMSAPPVDFSLHVI